MTLKGWRIAAPEFSKTSTEMFSGEGAFLYGGRWSSEGTRVVYLGGSLALAAFELLVHLDNMHVIKLYNKCFLEFDEDLFEFIEEDQLHKDWKKQEMETTLQAIGDSWAAKNQSLILKAPSVVIPGEYNYLLNPNHPDMIKASIGNIETFEYDPRVIKN